MTRFEGVEEEQLMLDPILRAEFVNSPVVIETEMGEISGVLVDLAPSFHGGPGSLAIYTFRGDWVIVKVWSALKTARSSS
jgi:hypothetical protein